MGAPSKASPAVIERARETVKAIVGKALATASASLARRPPSYWIVGGEYRDTQFHELKPGSTLQRHGPFASHDEARRKWAGLAMATVDHASTRFHIEKEPPAEYWVVGGRYADSSFSRPADGGDESRWGPFDSEAAALDLWRQKARDTEDDALAKYRVERI